MILNNRQWFFKFLQRISLVFLIISIVFPCISVSSQTDSLNQYMNIAAKNNPTVLQKFYEYKAALQKVPQAGGLPDPEVNVGVFLQPMELVNGNQVADIRLMQMFPWFGTLKAAKDEMSLMAMAKFESFRDAQLQVFFEMKRTWFGLQKTRKDIQISEQNIDILHTIERLSLIKFKASPATGNESNQSAAPLSSGSSQNGSGNPQGMQNMGGNSGTQPGANSNTASSGMQSGSMGSSSGGSGLADLYRIQIEIGDLENNVALLKSQLETNTARFNAYLNRHSLSRVYLPDELIPDSMSKTLLSVNDSMLNRNPMLGMLTYEQQSLDARRKMVTRMGYPMMGVGVNYSVISKSNSEMSTSSMNGQDMIMPMVTVTIPVYRKKYNAMKGETELLNTATKENWQATTNSLRTDYYAAIQLYQDAQRRMKLYENQGKLTKKTLDIMLKSFTTAGSGLTDILRVRQQTLDYDYKQVEAIADYNTAIAWLQRLTAFSPNSLN
jgi:outer membrane protein TolC